MYVRIGCIANENGNYRVLFDGCLSIFFFFFLLRCAVQVKVTEKYFLNVDWKS